MAIRCFLPPELLNRGRVQLSGSQARHLLRVLRVRRGEGLICLDGEGRQAQAKVEETKREILELSLAEPTQAPSPPCAITLAAAVPAQGKFETIVHQATELGVRAIIPLWTERCIIRFNPDRLARRMPRLESVAIEALKQSGNPWLPAIQPLRRWKEIVAQFSQHERILIATVEGPHEELRPLLKPPPRSLLLLIGPEGDFSPHETQEAAGAGARRVNLGPSVLRCETACVAALAVLQQLLREGHSDG